MFQCQEIISYVTLTYIMYRAAAKTVCRGRATYQLKQYYLAELSDRGKLSEFTCTVFYTDTSRVYVIKFMVNMKS